MVELPPLLLTANIAGVLKICAQLDETADPVFCDASRLIVAEPMALCALDVTLSRMQRFGRTVIVVGLSRQFKQHLESLNKKATTQQQTESDRNAGYQGTLHAY